MRFNEPQVEFSDPLCRHSTHTSTFVFARSRHVAHHPAVALEMEPDRDGLYDNRESTTQKWCVRLNMGPNQRKQELNQEESSELALELIITENVCDLESYEIQRFKVDK